ncbi:HAD-IA family hydrolase, partial [Streptomyces sp. NPDC005012]|uniref:HAD-IA family hydrolase n=1 Tax=Streptomyces sp. NPDC005012 TaxID=3154558 RepID=UPI0033AE1FDC
YNTTATAAEYWQMVAEDLGAEWDAAQRQRLWDLDIGNCLHPHLPTVRIVERLHGRVKLALLSDAPRDLARCLDGAPSMALFDRLFFSWDLKVNKPDPQAYEAVRDDTGVAPERTLFIDDKPANTQGAARIGWHTHHYTSAENLQTDLRNAYGL